MIRSQLDPRVGETVWIRGSSTAWTVRARDWHSVYLTAGSKGTRCPIADIVAWSEFPRSGRNASPDRAISR